MIHLREVDVNSRDDIDTLFKLLTERTPTQSISHNKMPTFGEHTRFVKSRPYLVWYLVGISDDAGYEKEVVGATYLSLNNEIGISIFRDHARRGYATCAVAKLMELNEGPFLANINPNNTSSRLFFECLGFKMLQVTYRK